MGSLFCCTMTNQRCDSAARANGDRVSREGDNLVSEDSLDIFADKVNTAIEARLITGNFGTEDGISSDLSATPGNRYLINIVYLIFRSDSWNFFRGGAMYITVLASTTVDLYFLHYFHLDSSEVV